MVSPKKDLEIIYNLQWKNNPGHLNDKANIVAMCDIPATTLNWETFKSYLLKNSGAAGDDVKVSYVSIDDKEFPIESQLDFQIALYSFRQRARQGGIITLKLDCISDTTRNGSKRLRMDDKPSSVPDINVSESESPEWFKKYMKEFKKDIIDEVTESVVNAVSALKLNNCNSRKAKFECCKRQRKNSLGHLGEVNEKELIKSLKLERKLDCKLEKLEQKTMKIKERKLTLLHNNENEKQNDSGFNPENDDVHRNVNVSIVGKAEVTIPHMVGGETYHQEWEIVNSGSVEWNSNTVLSYAWGSETLKPVSKIVPCPTLKPQEKGTISVYLEIPKTPGHYECYWYFHHEDCRIGRWVGCHFTVDPIPLNTLSLSSNEIEKQNEILLPPLNFNTSTPKKIKLEDTSERKLDNDILMNVNENLENLKIENQSDSLIGYESDPQSIISVAGSTSSLNSAQGSDEFVVLRLPESDEKDKSVESPNVCIPLANIKVEKIEESVSVENEDNNNNTPTNADISNSIPSNEPKSGYAYVSYNGQKIAVPKILLRADYLATAEDAPEPSYGIPKQDPSVVSSFETPSSSTTSDFESLPKLGYENISTCQNSTNLGNMLNSTCDNKSRLFVFPLNRPGFEVVYPSGHAHSVSESMNMHLNESCDSNPHSYVANQSTYLPSLNSLNGDNVSMLSACAGNASECPQCIYSQNVFTQSMPAPNFNHSKCGGQYCQQYINLTPKPTDNPERFNMQFTNSPRFQSEVNTPVHHNIPSAPHPPHTPVPSEAGGLHILPDTLVSGAVNVASSAINTARSVLNMFGMKPDQGKWMNGHWITTDPNSPREKALRTLYEMGFWDRDLNATLLARYNDDITQVISELVQ